MQSGTQETATAQETVTGRPILFIVRFLLLWFGSLIVVLAVTLLNDVNWTRPYMERTLSQALNRQVKLGKVNWSLGLNGIAIGTKTLTVTETSGEPFLTAGHSEIGLSVLGLIQRQIVITYIEADQADLRFVKTGADTWNIDDLLQPGPEIRLLQLTASKIGVFDQSTAVAPNRIDPIHLDKVELKLNFPKKHRKRPFFLAFSLPSTGYSSTFTLDGLGVGELGAWKDNHYTFKADAQQVNPRDLERLVKFISITPAKPVGGSGLPKSAVGAKSVIAKTGFDKFDSATKSGIKANSKPSLASKSAPGAVSTVATVSGAVTKSVTSQPETNSSAIANSSAEPKPTVTKNTVAKPVSVPVLASNKSTDVLEVLEPIKGLFDFKITGDGTFDKGIKATIETTANELQIDHPTLGQINAGKTTGSLEADLSSEKLVWSDMVLKLRGMQMRSSGALSHWQTNNPAIAANISGSLPDLGILQELVKPKTDLLAHSRGLSELTETLKPAHLTGRAEVEIKIDGTTNATNLTTKVKTHDLAIKDILNKAHQRFPILCAIGLSNQARIETDIRVQNSDRIEIVNGKLIGPGTNLSATGWLDLKNDKGDFTVTGDKIALNSTAVGISTNDGAYKQVLGCIKLPGKTSFTLAGTASAVANLKTEGDRYALDAKLKLADAMFALRDDSLKLDHVNGNVQVIQNNRSGLMTLSGITGHMGEGNFQLDGKIGIVQTAPMVDITLHATKFEMKHLSTLMKLFQIQQMPVITERQLYGRVKDVVLKITGLSTNPNVFFSAVPDDLYYQPPGLAKPLRAKAGTIVYDKDQLILRDVALLSNGKTIVTSMTIDKVSKECILSRVKAKSDSIELADINYYLSSTAMPPPMRKAYLEVLSRYRISGLTGKAYGDILCLIGAKGDVVFDGLIGCYKTSASVSGYPITKIEGIFAASGDQLLLQDLSGFVRGSKFSLDGYVDKYRSKSPSWRAEVVAKLAPRELIELIPHLTDELNTSRVEVKSKGALTLRAKVQGNFDYNKIQYSLVADKKDRMIVEGPFGKLYQPVDSPLTLDGLIGFNKSTVELGDTHILVGQTLISLDGLLTFPDEKAEPNKTDGVKISKSPTIRLNFRIPQKSQVSTLIGMVDPALAKEIAGTISGFLTLDGDLKNPRVLSDIIVSNINVASLKLSGLNGRLRSGGTPDASDATNPAPTMSFVTPASPPAVPSEPQAVDGNKPISSDSTLEIDSVKIRQLTITNLKAHVNLSASDKPGQTGQMLKIDKGEARLADGVMNFEATFNPTDNQSWLSAVFLNVSAARIGDELMGSPDEITGKGKATIVLETHGEDTAKLMKNLRGRGSVDVENGIVARFSDLETRLTQYNLLTQGIFGFNFNNLVQSVWPVRTGEFTSLNNKFSFADGLLKVEEMRFNGKDMRMWGSGTASLVNNKVKIEIAGKIPRVTGSRLGGGIGSVSRKFTLQKMMKMVTLGRLENLPALPVLGAIATDKPRTFMFSVDSELDNPKLIARSIEKSFKWLQNKPEATAHPVPGLVSPM